MRASSKERNNGGQYRQLVDGEQWAAILNAKRLRYIPFAEPIQVADGQSLSDRQTTSPSENR
jgi:hypothetical protein